MDMHGHNAPDNFRIDDLLDFSNADLFPSPTDPNPLHHHHHQFPPPENSSNNHPSIITCSPNTTIPNGLSASFTDNLCVPSDDVAELEWLSRFVDDSFADFPANELAGTKNIRPNASLPSRARARAKRFRASSTQTIWTLPPESDTLATGKSKSNNIKKKTSSPATPAYAGEGSPLSGVRRCTHCASEKTPQWRTGPLGPKTLCNACGVRYKSGRLVPEYRPAASPTFVLTQHSNSHRKVMELRRQKEDMGMGQENSSHHQFYCHPHDFQVC